MSVDSWAIVLDSEAVPCWKLRPILQDRLEFLSQTFSGRYFLPSGERDGEHFLTRSVARSRNPARRALG